MPEEEKLKVICDMAARMFPAIYKNRRAISHDTYDDIVGLTATTAINLFNSIKRRLNSN